ncbi:MAG: secondary thiamine-phosphate synthase enzyme YjbQ [Hyphomicrobiaceae bacterium]
MNTHGPLGQTSGTLRVATRGVGFIDVTRQVQSWLVEAGPREGLLTCFIRHTSASLVIQENADPDVLCDLAGALDRMAPRDFPYRHDSEGPDDMPAHIRTMLTSVSLSIPVLDGRMRLGTWQGLYVAEHRDAPASRDIALHFIGTAFTA